MMTVLQWLGTVSVVWAYWFYLTRPLLAICLTISGCIVLTAWALLLEPPAWGIVALEAAVTIISIRNFLKADRIVDG